MLGVNFWETQAFIGKNFTLNLEGKISPMRIVLDLKTLRVKNLLSGVSNDLVYKLLIWKLR